jgi:hypothetical protein
MLWSKAAGLGNDKWANIARHDVIVVGPWTAGLEWTPHKFPAMAETFQPHSVRRTRANLDRLRRLNPAAAMLVEVYFFEDDRTSYPRDHPWWLRDDRGSKKTFWPGTWQMDIHNAEYVRHVARRIGAVAAATAGRAGVFLDNVRFDARSKAAWIALLKLVRETCGQEMPILVNAGWDSEDVDWLAPYVNGIMYEDAIHHLPKENRDTEAFYARIAAADAGLRRPSISINEVFGKRNDLEQMRRELIRTLVYTDMAFLYADSTHGHRHAWYAAWDAPLGRPAGPPAIPRKGKLARRRFAGGEAVYLPPAAEAPVKLAFPAPVRDAARPGGAEVNELKLAPGAGAILVTVRQEKR